MHTILTLRAGIFSFLLTKLWVEKYILKIQGYGTINAWSQPTDLAILSFVWGVRLVSQLQRSMWTDKVHTRGKGPLRWDFVRLPNLINGNRWPIDGYPIKVNILFKTMIRFGHFLIKKKKDQVIVTEGRFVMPDLFKLLTFFFKLHWSWLSGKVRVCHNGIKWTES
jgi:hypothetical protein